MSQDLIRSLNSQISELMQQVRNQSLMISNHGSDEKTQSDHIMYLYKTIAELKDSLHKADTASGDKLDTLVRLREELDTQKAKLTACRIEVKNLTQQIRPMQATSVTPDARFDQQAVVDKLLTLNNSLRGVLNTRTIELKGQVQENVELRYSIVVLTSKISGLYMSWTYGDVLTRCDDRHMACSEEQAEEIIQLCSDNFDANHGFDWSTMDDQIDTYFADIEESKEC